MSQLTHRNHSMDKALPNISRTLSLMSKASELTKRCRLFKERIKMMHSALRIVYRCKYATRPIMLSNMDHTHNVHQQSWEPHCEAGRDSGNTP